MTTSGWPRRSLLLAALAVPALAAADSLCPDDKAARAADAQVARARQAEQAGRWQEAFDTASRADQDCVSSPQEVKGLRARAAQKLGQEAERRQELARAFSWYQTAEALPDADRVELAMVKKQPEQEKVVSAALDWFKRRGNQPALEEVRGVAARNADRALAAEEKAFAAFGHDSFDALDRARSWLVLTGAGPARAAARAGQRGDALAADDTRTSLGLALRYYQVAGQEAKRKAVQEKVRKLGEAHAARGEAVAAADFFELAGDPARARKVRDAATTRDRQAEKKRQKAFQEDQSKLEKELGL